MSAGWKSIALTVVLAALAGGVTTIVVQPDTDQAANRELARAIAASDGDSRVVQPAVDHFHDVMGELQQATIAHIFQMRAVMTPTQAERFDRSVVEALTAEGA